VFRCAESRTQPTDLPAVIDLVLGGVKPCEMSIHRGGSAEWLVQPIVVGTKRERGLPGRLLFGGGSSLLKRETVISALDNGDVSEQRADRVTRIIMEMIELRDAQTLDGGECRVTCVQ
jgi:hypothetical protein